MRIPLRELQHCNTATLQQREQSQACLSYAERQQLSTKSTLQQREQKIAVSKPGRLPKAEAEFACTKSTQKALELARFLALRSCFGKRHPCGMPSGCSGASRRSCKEPSLLCTFY